MVDNLIEAFKTDATLANISVEEADADNDVRKLSELGDFLRGRQGHEWAETGSGQHWLESGGDFSLDSVRDRSGQLDVGVFSDDVLLVLVEQVVEDLLVKQGDALEIVSWAGFKAHNLIDQAIGLMGEVGDVLLTLDLLLDISWIVADLELDSV